MGRRGRQRPAVSLLLSSHPRYAPSRPVSPIYFPFSPGLAIAHVVTSFSPKLIALAALLPGLFGLQSAPAWGQTVQGGSSMEVRRPEGAEDLGRYLSRLASNPRDVDALVGAGEAALRLNDPRAAAGFFARAQEASPSNARVKAGLARSMLGMENPVDALRLFGEAVRLGAREVDIAGDRALAYDLTGDQARAQQDYRIALDRNERDPILIRRYAVSLGISGKWQEADKLLDPLLRKSDKAAWRDRAFILAMNGRAKQARDITTVVMPPNMAAAIQPFMDGMPSLTPAQRAAAVHFGNFPAGAVKTAGPGIPMGPRAQSAPPAEPGPAKPAAGAVGKTTAKSSEKQVAAAPQARAQQPAAPPTPPTPARRLDIPTARQMATAPSRAAEPGRMPGRAPVLASDRIGPPADGAVPDPSRAAQGAPASVEPEDRRTLAEIMSTIAVPESEHRSSVAPVDLAEVARLQAERRKAEEAAAARAKAEADARARKAEAEVKAKAAAEAAEKAKHPARIWVQIATGRDLKALAFDMGKLRKKHPELLKGKDAWTSEWGATRRMVVGPFASTSAARVFTADWLKAGGDGYIWQSTDGLEIEKLGE